MYSEYADEYSEAIKDNIYNAHFERPSLFSMLPELKGLKVLDMGCGPGVYSRELIEKGAIVTGVDSSEKMIELTKTNAPKAINIYVQDLNEGLPNEKSSVYDIVLSPLVIHYIQDLKQLFSEVNRVLKPNGVFVFSTHHPFLDFKSSVSGNYFETEYLSQMWNTVGSKVKVEFFRRPLSELFSAIEQSNMSVISLNEGNPVEEMKSVSEKVYNKLKTTPAFIFIKCQPK